MKTNRVIVAFLMLVPSCELLGMQAKPKQITQAVLQRWYLTINRPQDAQETEKLVQEVRTLLKEHFFSCAIDDPIVFHLRGTEETLLKKMEGKPWFDKSKLKKIEPRQ